MDVAITAPSLPPLNDTVACDVRPPDRGFATIATLKNSPVTSATQSVSAPTPMSGNEAGPHSDVSNCGPRLSLLE